ncbi:unannotated protein [freshwater metagenome]|uniref:Unannotated protein n=1 Tax=freshwater metagenome TaxID=449393 RepID=A0A6J7DB55_9ZZZZ|nr:amino acid adenylation domain-containing protein [Actinomycetota bacterium]
MVDEPAVQVGNGRPASGYPWVVMQQGPTDPAGQGFRHLPDPEAPLIRQWDATVIDRFLERARACPDDIAIESPDGAITYRQLHSRAVAIARELIEAGATPGAAVAISGERSAGVAIAMLATLMAGLVMVPLPVDLPEAACCERIDATNATFSISIGEPRPFLTSTVLLDAYGRISPDQGAAPIGDADRAFPEPDDRAYVFFTSGSSGVARSVVGLHGSLCQFIDWQRAEFGIGSTDRVPMLTSIGFDVILRNVFLPWAAGGCLVVPPADLQADDVLTWLAAQRVTVVHLTPSLAELWTSTPATAAPPTSLRWSFFSGEQLLGSTVQRWRDRVSPPGGVVNLYGPTETCMIRSFHIVPDVTDPGTLSVGYPIPGSQLLVVNASGQQLGPGQHGEIVVRTVHGTAGYGNDRAAWADRATVGPAAGEVRFRTGDWGNYLADGTVVVRGRLDDVVAVNGARVDPADVAARLRRLPGIAAAGVVTVEESDGRNGLLAAIVPAIAGLTATEVRAALGELVPAGAVPRQIVFVQRLPLSANGKLDGSALQQRSTAPARVDHVASDGIEAAVVRIWKALFPEHAVDADTNFFDIGGHSLMALRLIHRIKTEFAVALPLRTVFSADTPAAIAQVISESITGRTQPLTPLHEMLPPAPAAHSVSGGEQRVPASRTQLPYLDLHDIDPALSSSVIGPMRVLLGPLDLEVLQSAFDFVVQRHSVLRAWFDAEAREQVIAAHAHLPIHVVHRDDRSLDMTELHQFLIDAAARDIEHWPLIRPVLVRLAPEQYLFALVAQHVVVDGRSNDILIDELRTAYEALITGQTPALAPIRSGAQEVVDHEQQLLADGVLGAELAYWRQILAPPVQALDLPTDRPRGTAADTDGQLVRLRIRPTTRACIEAAVAEYGASTFRVLTALWAAYLAGLVPDVTEVPLTTPSTVREVPDAASMTGMFVSLLPLRIRLAQHATVADAIRATSTTVTGAGRHRHVTFHQIRADLSFDWDRGRARPFEVGTNLLGWRERDEGDRHGLRWRWAPDLLEQFRETLELRCFVSDHRDLTMVLRYDAELLDHHRAETMLTDFARFVDLALDDPDRPIVAVAHDLARHAPMHVHHRISAHSAVAPTRPAVVDGDQIVEYATLDARTNALANALRAADVAPGSLVGVLMGRGADLVATLLAIHRIGAGYVPLSLDAPPARIELLLADTQPVAIVADRACMFATNDIVVVRTDEAGTTFAAADPRVDVADDVVAYVMHTSGSTGRPKGVAISHGALDAFVNAAVERYGIRPGDRVLQAHNIAFDTSVEEIFVTLAAGATLVIGREEDVFVGAEQLAAFVERHGITVLDLPTSFWHALVRDLEESGLQLPESIHHVIVGGQAIDPAVIRRWHRIVRPGIQLTNGYGPTEFTVVATTSDLALHNLRDGAPTPIGKPLAGVVIRVVDGNDAAVAHGERGELLLSGAQLARGYLGAPDLTAEGFAEIDGRRWYRTGDMVCERPDGVLEFHGRVDDQVKIRGFRIEPAEIEAALLGLPGVREAVVVATPTGPGDDPILVAHLLVREGTPSSTRQIRAALGLVLPPHLLPTDVVVHDELARTPGGKPDRTRLRSEYRPRVDSVAQPQPQLVAVPSGRPMRLWLTQAPLSYAQEAFWLLHQLDDADAYQIRLSLRLAGQLDAAALGSALTRLVSRHEILRTRYRTYDDGSPYQIIDSAAPIPLATHDMRSATASVANDLQIALRQPFALAEEWPIRAALMRIADAEHRLVLVLHHIACDAESAQILLRDLAAAYSHAVGSGPPLPACEFQFADHAVWERAQAAGGDTGLDADLRFWVEQLEGLPEPAQLPQAGDTASSQTDVAFMRVVVPAEVVDRLRIAAAALRVTPVALVFTSIGIAIGRIMASNDYVLGLPATIRSFGVDTDLVGPMINTLPFRFRSNPDDDVQSTVRRIFGEMAHAMEHRRTPFSTIVAATHAHRQAFTSPLLDIIANVFDTAENEGTPVAFPGLDPVMFDRDDIATPTSAKCDLAITARIARDLMVSVEYRSGHDQGAVHGWVAMIANILEQMTRNTGASITSLSSVEPVTEQWLRDQLNDTSRPIPDGSTVDGLVRDRITADPRRLAVIDGTARYTYSELDERTLALQARLIDAGVQPGDGVLLLLDRSFDLVVAMLACLRLGAAYIPIEPSQPAHRYALVLADSGATAAIRRSADDDTQLSIEALPERPPHKNPLPRGHGADKPAAVMYTSGSTGKPKGVVVPHRAIVRLVQGADYLQLGRDDVVAFASNPAFDAATWEVWGALTNGATLVVLGPDQVASPHRLAAAVRTHGVTAMFLTTALFNLIAREQPDALAPVHTILFGGEASDPSATRRVLATRTGGQLLHMYGPTECTTFALWHRVLQVADDASTIPIGLPIANTTAHVLGPDGHLVPLGVAGELYLGGDGLAIGYLGDDELTARRFVTDHLRPGPGARLYRTGDLVRRVADGRIEFVGRVDRQVKVRGFRIQPEEVEAALMALPAISAAVVEADRGPDGTTLTAFVEARGISEREVRRQLGDRLSANMIPSNIVVVERLPLTANGKLDRAALGATMQPAKATTTAAHAQLSGVVVDIWARRLGDGAGDPDVSFFDLGGHSMLAVRLLTAIRKELGIDLALSVIFEHQTLRQLCAEVDRHRNPATVSGPRDLFVTLRTGSEPPLYLVHPGGGHVFDYVHLGAHLPEGRALIGITAKGLDGQQRWDRSVEEMAVRYVAAIATRSGSAPVLVGGYSSGGAVAYEMARRLLLAGHPVEGLILIDPSLPTDKSVNWHNIVTATRSTAGASKSVIELGRGIAERGVRSLRFRIQAVGGRRWRLMRFHLYRRLGRTTPEAMASAMNLEHHYAIVPLYKPTPLPTPVRTLLVLAATDRTDELHSSVATSWEQLIGTAPTTVVVEGRHTGTESLLKEPRVAAVADGVQRFMAGRI